MFYERAGLMSANFLHWMYCLIELSVWSAYHRGYEWKAGLWPHWTLRCSRVQKYVGTQCPTCSFVRAFILPRIHQPHIYFNSHQSNDSSAPILHSSNTHFLHIFKNRILIFFSISFATNCIWFAAKPPWNWIEIPDNCVGCSSVKFIVWVPFKDLSLCQQLSQSPSIKNCFPWRKKKFRSYVESYKNLSKGL